MTTSVSQNNVAHRGFPPWHIRSWNPIKFLMFYSIMMRRKCTNRISDSPPPPLRVYWVFCGANRVHVWSPARAHAHIASMTTEWGYTCSSYARVRARTLAMRVQCMYYATSRVPPLSCIFKFCKTLRVQSKMAAQRTKKFYALWLWWQRWKRSCGGLDKGQCPIFTLLFPWGSDCSIMGQRKICINTSSKAACS